MAHNNNNSRKHGYKPISDYGAIGNLRTLALVGLDGSIDWCCVPNVGSSSVFASILDAKRGGRFKIAPAGINYGKQYYIDDTNVLVTQFDTGNARLTITDFMPLKGDIDGIVGRDIPRDEIHRILRCEGGRIDVEVNWSPRPEFAQSHIKFNRMDGGWIAVADKTSLTLGGVDGGKIVDNGSGPELTANFQMQDGEQRLVVTRWGTDDASAKLDGSFELLRQTIESWSGWVHKNEAKQARAWTHKWHNLAIRSGLVLKLLTYLDTGAIIAAPTTSLPETIGGIRNWDYRFVWVRDAALTVQGLRVLGHEVEGINFLYWINRMCGAIMKKENKMQIMYGVEGETKLVEHELGNLNGYRDSRPVRIGNLAAKQLQLDIYGELLDSAYELLRRGYALEPELMEFLSNVANRACALWQEPDSGIWEVRGELRHFVYSKVMAWVALDRAVHLAGKFGLRGNVVRWKQTMGEIRKTVLAQGYNQKFGSFVQSFGSESLDAANLLIPIHGFLPFTDKRIQQTINMTIEKLTENDLVYRYRSNDNLPGEEGTFCICTFWLISALALSGRTEEAWHFFENIAGKANHLGLFSEELNPKTGEFLGNFPQAYSHIGLINALLFLSYKEGREIPGPSLVGTRKRRAELTG